MKTTAKLSGSKARFRHSNTKCASTAPCPLRVPVLEPLPERRNTDAWSHISPEQNIHPSPRSVWRQFRDIWIRMAHTGSWGEPCRSLKVRAESSYGVSQKDPRGASARANGAYLDARRAAVIFQPVYCQFNELNITERPWKYMCCGG